MAPHIFERYFRICGYDLTVDPNERLWATDNVYMKKGKKKYSKKFFRTTIDNLKTQLFKMDLKHRNVYEFVVKGVPSRLYLDLENEETHDVDVNAIIRQAFRFTKELGWDVKFHVYLLDSSDEKKFSNHLIIRMIQKASGKELFFKDVCSVGAFVRRCFSRLPLGDPLLKFIDHQVYTDNRQFRIGGSGKNGGGRYFCFKKGKELLSPDDTLRTFETFLIQDHSLTDQETVEVCEENGMTGLSRVITFSEYRDLYYPQEGDEDIPLADVSNVIEDRKRKLKMEQKKLEDRPLKKQRTSPTSSFKGPLWPSESLFYEPKGYDIKESPGFFDGCDEVMEAVVCDRPSGRFAAASSSDFVTLPLTQFAFHESAMKDDQKAMFASIQANRHKLTNLTKAEQIALDFMDKNCKTRKTLAEMCATWLMELTLDTGVAIVQTSYSKDEEYGQPMESGFVFSCPNTLTCHKKGMDHKSNKILMVFDVMKATATQQCHDKVDCGSKPGVQIILPLKIRYAMFLTKTWRDLYYRTFF